MIVHELAHLLRRDHWVRLLEITAGALLWWHPLIWLARRGLRDAEEQCCDAWAVALLPDSRREYADALVDVLEQTNIAPLPAGATGLGRITHLKRRLTMILDRTPPKSLSLLGKVVVVLLMTLLPLVPVPLAKVHGQAPAKTATTSPLSSATAAVDDSTRKAVEALLEMAQDSHPQVHVAGVQAILRFGPQAVPILVDALREEKTAATAQKLLCNMGGVAIDGLIDAVHSPDASIRLRGLQALHQILAPPSEFADGGHGTPSHYNFGMVPGTPNGQPLAVPPEAMAQLERLTKVVMQACEDSSAPVRGAAVHLLGTLARQVVPPDKTMAQPLVGAMKDEDVAVRRQAAQAMMWFGRLDLDLTPLVTAVGDSDATVRTFALTALGSMGDKAKSTMATVVGALKYPDMGVRIAAANALGAMQMHPPEATPTGGGPGTMMPGEAGFRVVPVDPLPAAQPGFPGLP